MKLRSRPGFGLIEGLVVVAILAAIGALVYFAVVPKKSPQATSSSSPAAQSTPASIAEVESDRQQLEAEDGSDVQKELDSLTTDLNTL